MNCPEQSGGESACLGASVIIRMSFTLCCFHIFVFLVCLARNEMAAGFHDGCWGVKFLFVFGLFTGSMWINNNFMKGYMDMTRVVSTFFLMYQALLMLIVSYGINDRLVLNVKNDKGKCSAIILILVMLGVTVINVWWIVAQYQNFRGCSGNNWIMTLTLFVVIAMHVLVVFLKDRGGRQDASILTSGIASMYILYLQWTAFSSSSNPTCNPNLASELNVTF